MKLFLFRDRLYRWGLNVNKRKNDIIVLWFHRKITSRPYQKVLSTSTFCETRIRLYRDFVEIRLGESVNELYIVSLLSLNTQNPTKYFPEDTSFSFTFQDTKFVYVAPPRSSRIKLLIV